MDATVIQNEADCWRRRQFGGKHRPYERVLQEEEWLASRLSPLHREPARTLSAPSDVEIELVTSERRRHIETRCRKPCVDGQSFELRQAPRTQPDPDAHPALVRTSHPAQKHIRNAGMRRRIGLTVNWCGHRSSPRPQRLNGRGTRPCWQRSRPCSIGAMAHLSPAGCHDPASGRLLQRTGLGAARHPGGR